MRQGSGPSSVRAGATVAPGRSRWRSVSTPLWFATRAPSSRTPRTTVRSGAADFDASLAAGVLEFFRSQEQPAVVFTDRGPSEADFIVASYPTGREFFDDYVQQNREHAEIDPGWMGNTPGRRDRERDLDDGSAEPFFHVCAIGSRIQMNEFQRAAQDRMAGQIQTFVQRSPRYLGTMCEILRHDASKWAAILHLADLWGVQPGAICAVGDDANDIPMIRNAGLGVAMGHAHPDVLCSRRSGHRRP